jgi:hypothetical protein
VGVTYNGLREADFSALEAVGAQWLTQAERFDERDGDLDEVRRNRLGVDNWDGDTADRARATVRVIGEDLADCATTCRRIASAIEDALEVFLDRKRELETLVSSAPEGVVIGGDGTARAVEPDDVQHSERASAVNAQIRTILDAVTEADETLHAAIAAVAGTANASEQLGLNGSILKANELRELLGQSPAAIKGWWDALSPFEQQGLLDRFPELLASTDGIPSGIRDTANRALLDRELMGLDRKIDRLEQERARLEANGEHVGRRSDLLGDLPSGEYARVLSELSKLQERRDDLGNLRDKISEPYAVPNSGQALDYFLLSYDSTGDGQAIVSVGNPDTADNVNVYVPGTGSELGNATNDINRAERMTGDAYRLSDSGTATVMWLGYDAPDNVFPFVNGGIKPEAAFESYARDAAPSLSTFADGLRATSESGANVTMTGHSYGSTTVGVAARDAGLDVDNMIFVGSPGVGVDNASDLGIDPANVWASRNDQDIITAARPGNAAQFIPFVGPFMFPADQMVHGRDPVADGFGGNTFSSDSTRSGPVANHSAYWDQGNASRENMAYIVTGQPDMVR